MPNGLCLAAGTLCGGQPIVGVLHRSYTWVPEGKMVVCLSVFGGLGCTDWCRHKTWSRNQCLEKDVRLFKFTCLFGYHQILSNCWETATIKPMPS